MIGPEYIQVAIKSEIAAAKLQWIGADQAELPDPQSLALERKKYQEQFGEVFAKQMNGNIISLLNYSSLL